MLLGRLRLCCAVAALLLSWAVAGEAKASTYQQLYKFPSGVECCFPESLIRGPHGSLFGVQGANYFDPFDGQQGAGTGIFELDPPAAGQTAWTYSLIFSYNPDYPQPGQPPGYMNPELLMDPAGNLYFGTGTGVYQPRVAAVVKLSPPAPGTTAWTQTILYDHHSPTYPNIASFHLTYIDNSGILFGYDDKSDIPGVGGGSVFQVRPPATGQTQGTVTVLTRFGGPGNEYQSYPRSLLKVADGSFYGLANDGVVAGVGVPIIAFHLRPPAVGQTGWTRTTVFPFGPNSYQDEPGPLIADRSLNLYGVAKAGGTANDGYMYKLSPPAAGQTAWQRSVLYNFQSDQFGQGPGGFEPWGALVNWNGFLLGTAQRGGGASSNVGCDFGCGTLFQLSATAAGGSAGSWNDKPLHRFGGGPYDGAQPFGPVVPVTQTDGTLALFGVTLAGGHQNSENGNGIIYELIP